MLTINSIDIQVHVIVDTQAMNSFTYSINLKRIIMCAVQLLINCLHLFECRCLPIHVLITTIARNVAVHVIR